MGRPERPVDQHSGPIAELAAQLRRLRDSAGRPSYRELARRASFSTTVLSEAAGGRTLPTLPVVKAYVRACGGDVGEWEERWRQLAAQLSEDRRENGQAGGRAGTRAPYLGLASYNVADADLYFGREALTAELLQRLTKSRFLAVFGSSGSGKSSLLRAGLMAAVARGDPGQAWTAAILTPGPRPVAALAEPVASLAGTPAEALSAGLMADPGQLNAAVQLALAGQPPEAELLLVVDQFEEAARNETALSTRCWRRSALRTPGSGWRSACGPTSTATVRGGRGWSRPCGTPRC
jgi:Helix-turn-helix domain